MSRSFLLLPFLLVLLLAAPARAVGVTGFLDDLEAELLARRSELAGSPDKGSMRAVKSIDKALAALAKETLAESYAGELKGAAKAGKIVEKKLAAEAGLAARLGEAAAAYTGLLGAARDRLEAEAGRPGIPAKEAKRLAKNLKKADKALAAAAGATSPSKRLKLLAKAAKALAGFIEAESGGTFTWVISEVTAAPAGEGMDLDGDGEVDNALGSALPLLALAGLDVNAVIAEGLAGSDQVGLIQMWGIDDFGGDPEVGAGLANGFDTDLDPTDNFSGGEAFVAPAGALAADGHPKLRTVTGLGAGGAYEIEITGEEVSLVGFDLPPEVSYRVRGTARPESNAGLIGLALPIDELLALAAEQGVELPFGTEFLIRGMADIDLDGDGLPDAISAAFRFESVPAVLY